MDKLSENFGGRGRHPPAPFPGPESLSSSEKSLFGKKAYPYILRILQISFTHMFFSFFWQMPFYTDDYAKRLLYSFVDLNTVLLSLSTKMLKI